MSKKLVIPTLETQQKYPLFYAEATKTINDIIEHISKERGIYISNIEPDPKEHLIWFNTNFNTIYFYDEKTKSFMPLGEEGSDLNTITILINDLRKEIGNRDDWYNEEQYSTIYEALGALQIQVKNINSTIIPVYTVSDKNELFNVDFDLGVYKIREYFPNVNLNNYYILIVGGKPDLKTYKLYGNNGIFIQKTVDGVKQFVSADFDIDDILGIIGSGKFISNLENASTITDAVNILSSTIGDTDINDTDLSFMNNNPILPYLRYISDTLDINGFSDIVAQDENGRKVAEMFSDLQTSVNKSYNDKQNKIDNSLTTTDKTIVGAINELHSLLLSLQNKS